jgi:hypothetical protein
MTHAFYTETSATVTKHELRISKSTLLEILRHAGYSIPTASDVSAFVHVPGGGDWSNEDLDLVEAPIVVSWETRK